MEFRALKENELDKWLDHCLYVFNKGQFSQSYRQYFKNHWINDPWKDLDSILVAVDKDEIASTVRIFHRKIYLIGQTISMGGIGEVSTKPEYQHKGLSTKLFNLAIDRMEKLGISISILSAMPEKRGYYNKLGWQGIQRRFNVSIIRGRENPELNIRPVDFYTDISQISLIHEIYSRRFNGVVVRDKKSYWRDWVKTEAKHLYLIEKAGEIIAYVDFEVCDKTIRIREFGQLSEEINIFSSLAEKLAYMNGIYKGEVVYCAEIPSKFNIDRVTIDDSEMVRLIKPFTLDNTYIESTEALINCFKELTYWDIDAY